MLAFVYLSALAALAALAEAGDLGYGSAISYASYAPGLRVAAGPVAYAQPALHTVHAAVPALTYAKVAAPVAVAAPIAKVVQAEPYDPNPSYSFSYGVSDPHTGDAKQQKEELSNGVVQGVYSLVEPDGTTRTVHYTADPHNGFNAVVDRQPAKVAVAAPIAKVAVASPYSVYH